MDRNIDDTDHAKLDEPKPKLRAASLADLKPNDIRSSESSFRRGYCHGFENALALFEAGVSIARLRQLGDDILDWREDYIKSKGNGEWGHFPPTVRPIQSTNNPEG